MRKWILYLVLQFFCFGVPYAQGEASSPAAQLSPAMARIEWIRKQVSWILGRKYRPSQVVEQLSKKKDPGPPSVRVARDNPRVSRKDGVSASPVNLWSKRRIYRWRCKSCRLYGKERCPRCYLDLEKTAAK